MASRSGQAHVPSRRSSERRLILLAALIAIAAGLLVAVQPSSELDLDVLFPLTENSSSIDRGPARQSVDTSEASVVRWFLLALATVVAVPLMVLADYFGALS